MYLLNQVYKYGSGNSKVTSLPVSFRYTEAKVSTCNNKKNMFFSMLFLEDTWTINIIYKL